MKKTTEKATCSDCAWRAIYDERPRSFSGRMWRWHTYICPGWKAFLASLSNEEYTVYRQKYNLRPRC